MNGGLRFGFIVLCGVVIGTSAWAPIGAEAQEHHHRQRQGDRGSVERWLPRLEGEGRDERQRPDYVVGLLDIAPGMTVVDLGTGTGYFVSHLARAVGAGGRVLALDVDDELVDYVAGRARDDGFSNVEARVIPFDDPELEPGSVDRVLIVNTWHHIEDREPYARKLAAALSANGAVYIVDFTMDSPYGPSKSHRLAQEVVETELAAGGLEVEALDEELESQYVVVGRPHSSD